MKLILIEFLPLPCKDKLLLSVRDNIILKTPITEWVFLWLVMIWHWCGWRYEKTLLLKKEERAETSTILNSCDAERECKREVTNCCSWFYTRTWRHKKHIHPNTLN